MSAVRVEALDSAQQVQERIDLALTRILVTHKAMRFKTLQRRT